MIMFSFNIGLNHIYQELCKVWPEADSWASKCNVFKKGLYQEFNGDGCNTLLKEKSLDMLDTMIPQQFNGFSLTLRHLSKVVKGCFSYIVAPTIEEDIENFKASYLDLNITVTPKVSL